MKINNGFIKMSYGGWKNLSSIKEFRVMPSHHPINKFYIAAIYDTDDLYGEAIEEMKYSTEEEAQESLDFWMGRKD